MSDSDWIPISRALTMTEMPFAALIAFAFAGAIRYRQLSDDWTEDVDSILIYWEDIDTLNRKMQEAEDRVFNDMLEEAKERGDVPT